MTVKDIISGESEFIEFKLGKDLSNMPQEWQIPNL